MKISGSLLLALCLVSPWVSSEIFKCTDGKGNDKYQNFPCSIDSIGSKATAAPPKEEPDRRAAEKGSEQTQATGSAHPAQVAATAVAPAAGQKQPERGMKMDDVRATWGVPKSTDVFEGTEIWYYDVPSGNVLGVRFDLTGTVQRVGEIPKIVDSND